MDFHAENNATEKEHASSKKCLPPLIVLYKKWEMLLIATVSHYSSSCVIHLTAILIIQTVAFDYELCTHMQSCTYGSEKQSVSGYHAETF